MKSMRLFALFLCPALLAAQDWLGRIDQQAAKVEPEIVAIRHQIHQHPELSDRKSVV